MDIEFKTKGRHSVSCLNVFVRPYSLSLLDYFCINSRAKYAVYGLTIACRHERDYHQRFVLITSFFFLFS